MRSARVIGMLILGVWLVLWGLLNILNLAIPMQDTILGAMAVAAGIMLLLGL